MMECGDMTRRMAKGFISIRMEHNIKEAGKKICRMDRAQNSGQIHPNLRGITKRVGKMVLESICGLMGLYMRGNGKKMRLLGMVTTSGMTEGSILGIGKET